MKVDENEMNDSGKSRGKVVFCATLSARIYYLLSIGKFRKGLQALGLNVQELENSYPASPACMDILETFLVL